MPREIVQLAPDAVLSETSGGTGVDGSQAPQGATLKGTGSGFALSDASLFASTADVQVVNTVVETTLKGAGVGTSTLLANALAAGRMLRCWLAGIISTAAVPGTFTLRAKLNATNIITGPAGTPTASMSNLPWRLLILFTCRAVGIAGSIMGNGVFENKAAATNVAAFNAWDMKNNSPITINTTLAQTFDVTAQWGTADPANSILCTHFALQLI